MQLQWQPFYFKIDFFVREKKIAAQMPPSRGLTYEKPNIESYVPTFFNNCTPNASIMRKPQQNSFPLKCNIQNYFLIVIWIIIFFVPLYWEWVIIFGDVSHLLPHITNLWQPNIYIGNVYYSNIFIGNVYCSNIVTFILTMCAVVT